MPGFTIAFDQARGVLVCRVGVNFVNDEAAALIAAITPAVAQARQHGSLRFLWDNRAGKVFPDEAANGLWRVVGRDADPADRIAVLVSNSVAKVQSRAKIGQRGEAFASENAAYVWLSVGVGRTGGGRTGAGGAPQGAAPLTDAL